MMLSPPVKTSSNIFVKRKRTPTKFSRVQNGQAQRILEEARAYKTQTILEAQGEVARFAKLLPEYKAAPEITRERLYIETMEKC